MEEKPEIQPCDRHRQVGREYDHGCFSCQRQHTARVRDWRLRTLTMMQTVTVESIFVREQ